MESPLDRAGSETDWEGLYVAGDTPWDKGSAHPALIAWLADHPMTGRILVPGCGRGYDVRAMATPQNEVIGFDLAPSAVAAAKAFPATAGVSYELGDFFDTPQEWENSFDWIFEHTCFCAIDPTRRTDYVRQAARLLKPGGRLLAIFFLNPNHRESGPPYGCTEKELAGLFGSDFELLEKKTDLATYEGRENREMLQLLVCSKPA